MKLNNNEKNVTVESTAVFEGHDAQISKEKMGKLFDLLQDPYKDSISSLIREYTSNCFDSHAEAGVDDPVIVKIDKDDGGTYISFQDFGTGMSPEIIRDVFSLYLESTKEESNDYHGCYGIGSKSGLSYTDIVHITTRVGSKEYYYLLRKSEKAPRIDLIETLDTTERNGTKIKIYIKETKKFSYSYSEPETHKFIDAVKKQLCYFDNVFFDGQLTKYPANIDNEYKIYEGKYFKHRIGGLDFSNKLHICLGKVAYPIDWETLGEKEIRLPFALKFDIGELSVILTREDIKYTDENKAKIKQRIADLKEELIELVNKQTEDTDDLKYYLDKRNDKPTIKLEDNVFVPVDSFIYPNMVNKIEYTPLKGMDFKIPDYPFFDYYQFRRVREGRQLIADGNNASHIIDNKKNVYRLKGVTSPLKNKYLSYIEGNPVNDIYIIKQAKPKLKYYVTYLNLKWEDRSQWRKWIVAYQKAMLSEVISRTKSYDKLEVTKEFIKDNKAARSYDKGRISVKWYGNGRKTWESGHLVKGDIPEKTNFIIYGTPEEKEKLEVFGEFIHKIRPSNMAYKVIQIAKTNRKYFTGKNQLTIEQFMEGKTKPFKKLVTAYKIEKEIRHLLSNSDDLSMINESIGKTLKELCKYWDEYDIYKTHDIRLLLKEMYEVAEKHNIFDQDIVDKINTIKEYFKGAELLEYIDWCPEAYPHVAEYMKSKKKKVNLIYYQTPTKEEEKWMEGNYDLPEENIVNN